MARVATATDSDGRRRHNVPDLAVELDASIEADAGGISLAADPHNVDGLLTRDLCLSAALGDDPDLAAQWVVGVVDLLLFAACVLDLLDR